MGVNLRAKTEKVFEAGIKIIGSTSENMRMVENNKCSTIPNRCIYGNQLRVLKESRAEFCFLQGQLRNTNKNVHPR